jgi:hypothetical protein
MKRRVVDTNVGVVANGRNTNASLACRSAALDALASILREGRIVVDASGEWKLNIERISIRQGSLVLGIGSFKRYLQILQAE